MNIYAFDVDETLKISGGPVGVDALRSLRAQGHVVGICGNWAKFVHSVPDWSLLVSFLGPMEMTKAAFLRQIKTYIKAEKYIVVGNVKGLSGASDDFTAATDADWEFVQESVFSTRWPE